MKRLVVHLGIVLGLLGIRAAAQQVPSGAKAQFTFDWPQQNPPHYTITLDAAGHMSYESAPAADPNGGTAPEPYTTEWNATESVRSKLFDSIVKLNYLSGKFESKAKVAMTGNKTLHYEDGSHNNTVSFNYSDNAQARDLVQAFQSIAYVVEAKRRLEKDLRFDKLGVDADLKDLQQQQKQGNAMEFASIAPLLRKIANDASMLRISQQRAKEMLRVAGIDAQPPAGEN